MDVIDALNEQPPKFEDMLQPSLWYGKLCYQSYPCKHRVQIKNKDGSKQTGIWSSLMIYEWLVKNNLPVDEHMMEYKDFKFPS